MNDSTKKPTVDPGYPNSVKAFRRIGGTDSCIFPTPIKDGAPAAFLAAF